MNQFEAVDQLEELARKLRELEESISENRASALINEQRDRIKSSADLIGGLAALNRIAPVEPKSKFITLAEAQKKRELGTEIIGDGDKPGRIPLPPFISHRVVRFRADQLAALASFRNDKGELIPVIRIYPGLERGVYDGKSGFFYAPILATEDKNGSAGIARYFPDLLRHFISASSGTVPDRKASHRRSPHPRTVANPTRNPESDTPANCRRHPRPRGAVALADDAPTPGSGRRSTRFARLIPR